MPRVHVDKSKLEIIQAQQEVVDEALELPTASSSFDASKLAVKMDAAIGNTLQELSNR